MVVASRKASQAFGRHLLRALMHKPFDGHTTARRVGCHLLSDNILTAASRLFLDFTEASNKAE